MIMKGISLEKKVGIALLPLLLPFFAFAQGDLEVISDYGASILGFINGTLIPIVFGLALLVFLWGMFKYFILGGGDDAERGKGKQLMLWAVIGFVVMVSIFGIVQLLSNGLGLEDDDITLPQAPGVTSTGGDSGDDVLNRPARR
jgi:hypothetical protein